METEKENRELSPADLKRKRWRAIAAGYGIGSAIFFVGTVAANAYWVGGGGKLPTFWAVVYTAWFFTELVAALVNHVCEEDSEEEE